MIAQLVYVDTLHEQWLIRRRMQAIQGFTLLMRLNVRFR